MLVHGTDIVLQEAMEYLVLHIRLLPATFKIGRTMLRILTGVA
jgi:hypothetical protein